MMVVIYSQIEADSLDFLGLIGGKLPNHCWSWNEVDSLDPFDLIGSKFSDMVGAEMKLIVMMLLV